MLMSNDSNSPATTAQCTVQIVTDDAGFDQLQAEWDELFLSSPTASPPLRFDWVRTWWRIYGPVYGCGGTGLRLITIRRNGRLIGALPLYQTRSAIPLLGVRRLRFISTGAAEFEETCAEYLDLLHAPGEAGACVELLVPTLTESPQLCWDELILPDMSPTSPLLELGRRMNNGRLRVQQYSPGDCHIAELGGGLEQYLASLSPTTRKKARKMLRDLESPDYTFELAVTTEQINLFFDQMVELHRRRWTADGKAGSFAPRHAQFHRELLLKLAPSGQAVMARLSYCNRPVALSCGHRVRAKFDGYQMGVDHDIKEIHSPGAALYLGLASYLIREGVIMCDQLLGCNRFKMDYCKQKRALMTLKLVKPTLRLAAAAAVDLARRSMRKASRFLASAAAGAAPTPPQSPVPDA
jgi:CelD/BcsL family acetyltransferase involved in cellulose biosynthesis